MSNTPFFSIEARRIFLGPLFMTAIGASFVTYKDVTRSITDLEGRTVAIQKDVDKLDDNVARLTESLRQARELNASQDETIKLLLDEVRRRQ